jgi:KDEL-tailed cysteine endopeptidase
MLLAAIAQQPVSVAIDVNTSELQFYSSGVYNGNCGTEIGHAVAAVGYGTRGVLPYFKIKNSWGITWGEKGYMYLLRNGNGKGKCGILEQPVFPNA